MNTGAWRNLTPAPFSRGTRAVAPARRRRRMIDDGRVRPQPRRHGGEDPIDDRVVGQRHVDAFGAVDGVGRRRRDTARRAPRARAPSPRCGSTPSPRRRAAASLRPSRCPSSPVPRNATVAIAGLPLESTPVLAMCAAHGLAVSELCEAYAAPLTIGASWRSRPTVARLPTQPRVLRWAGDPEGGAPFVEADPSHPDEVVGFDVEIAGAARARPRPHAGVRQRHVHVDRSDRSRAATPTSA